MEQVVIAPVEWSRLRDIDDTPPVSESDYACLSDVRDALKRHGMLDRFGVALLHSHFDLDPDEVWLEETDDDTRTLVSRPVKAAAMGEGNVGTIWHLREGEILAAKWCRKFCERWFLGHSKAHNRV